MNAQQRMQRREFFSRFVFGSAVILSAASWLGACGPGQAPAPGPGSDGDVPGIPAEPANNPGEGLCFQNGAKARVDGNHGHELVIPKEDIAAGTQKTYSIQGTADHDHRVTVTSMDFSNLQGDGYAAEFSSDTGGHTHKLVIGCVTP